MRVIDNELVKTAHFSEAVDEEFLKSDIVQKMARSIAAHGMKHYPTVRKEDGAICWGKDRIAAHIILKESFCMIRYVECTDDEVKMMQDVESSHHIHDYEMQSNTELLLLNATEKKLEREKHLAIEAGNFVKRRGPGRKKTSKADARALVALVIGTTPEALRATERRATNPDDSKNYPRTVWALERYGMSCPQSVLDASRDVRLLLVQAEHSLRRITANLTSMESLSHPASFRKVAIESARNTSRAIRDILPFAMCPYCKATPRVMDICAACLSVGYVNEATYNGAPEDLKKLEVVMHHGQMVDMRTLRPTSGPTTGPRAASHDAHFADSEDFIEEQEPPREYKNPQFEEFDEEEIRVEIK